MAYDQALHYCHTMSSDHGARGLGLASVGAEVHGLDAVKPHPTPKFLRGPKVMGPSSSPHRHPTVYPVSLCDRRFQASTAASFVS